LNLFLTKEKNKINMITKRQAKKLMEIKGETRGVNMKIHLDFILEKKGEQGLKKVEAKMAELGFPSKREEIIPMAFYPIGLEVIILLIIKEMFNFNEKDFVKMGGSIVKFSILMKTLMKYFGSLNLIAQQVPKIWRRHYTIGELEMPEFSEEERYAILIYKNFKVLPIYCYIHNGYFIKVAGMVVKAPVTCKETKCMFKGDKYHEFLLTW